MANHPAARRWASRSAASVAAVMALAMGQATPAAAAGVDYVALGDSYAAGTGAGKYLDSGCGNTRAGYPSLLDAQRGVTLTARATCSGATTSDVVATQVASLSAKTSVVTLTVGGN